ncbi:MAG: hypothetical protein ACRD1F_08975, partial [Terriglobales bacterium]
MPEFLEDRRSSTRSRICRLRSQLTAAEDRCGVKACVYITGSVGRHEAGPQSDLDLFIADLGNPEKCLSAQDEILIAADLIKESRSARFPELALGGEHRLTHTMGELVGNLGTDRDDATNTLTARCLLLLESKLLLGGKAYSKLVDGVLGRYWRDYADHRDDFVPAFLTRTSLINIGAGAGDSRGGRSPESFGCETPSGLRDGGSCGARR